MRKNKETKEETIEISLNYDETSLIIAFTELMAEYLRNYRNSLDRESKKYYARLSSRIIRKISNAIDEKGYE